MLKAALFILRIELLLRLRRSQEWMYPIGFFIIVVSLFPLAFTPDPAFLQKYVPGCIWIAALFSSLLSIENIFFTETEEGHLEQLLLSQLPLTLLMLIKLTAEWLVTELPLILLIPLLGYLFHLPLSAVMALCVSLLLGTPILTLVGSLGVALTLGLRQQGALLGLLTLPLVTPILLFGTIIVQQSQTGFSIAGPVAFLGGCLLFSVTLIPPAIAAAVRMGVDD
jgi:heme exporter protein B